MVYCPIAKVGTSTWLKHFVLLAPNDTTLQGLDDPAELHKVVPPFFKFSQADFHELDSYSDDSRLAMQRFLARRTPALTFSFVRHPFDRLVSAYTDKVLGHASGANLSSLAGKSFPEFIDHVLQDARRCGSNPACHVNNHWRPQYMECLHCDFDYDVVGKVETFADDVKYIVIKQNLTHLIPVNVTTLKTHASKDIAQKHRTMNYFCQLTKGQIRSLCDFYKLDFELFDYVDDGYVTC